MKESYFVPKKTKLREFDFQNMQALGLIVRMHKIHKFPLIFFANKNCAYQG
jgi:hypothetical protein